MNAETTTLTRDEALAKYDLFTPGLCNDGFYEVDSNRKPQRDLEGVESVHVRETGLKGWPGEHFVCVDHGGGHTWTAFASLRD